jgi:hypothetical protein
MASGLWTDKHDELAALHLGLLNDHAILAQGVGNLVQGVEADRLRIDNLPTAEPHRHFDFIFLGEKFLDLPDFKIKIVVIGFGPELDLPRLDNGLLLFSFLLLFLQFVPEFVEIHDSANGWIRFIGYFHQVKSLLVRGFKCGARADYSSLSPVGIDEANLSVIDILVDFNFQILI